ncbi:AraC family transcriptional regulator, partial [Bacillus wiedmannii]|nr:AraC family transcriptional regulator [Bacillus wiedmannii]
YKSKIEQLHVLFQKNDSFNSPIFRTHQYLGHFILIHIKSHYMVNGTVIIGPLTHVNFSTSKTDSNLNFISNYKRTRDRYFSLSVKDQNFFVNIAIL